MDLAQRSVTSATWNVISNLSKTALLFGRSLLLARLLPVEVFGTYAFASSVVGLSVIFANFGISGALLHHAPETEDEEHAAAIHFTLKFIFLLIWATLLVTFTLLFAEGQTRVALLLLTFTTSGIQLFETSQVILQRRVIHRRLALLQLLNASFTTLVALSLAWQGVTLWALLATDVVTLIVTIVILYIWRPVWRPRLTWSGAKMRYFLSFGGRSFIPAILVQALDRVDDLWTGFYLGKTALGLYSRAYTFATYPRHILADPVNMVATGTYAELKTDRLRLSQAFFRTNALLIRGGFFFAGLLALLAPEFIRLVIGIKWLPMLDAFRLMLIFTMLDPIKSTISKLFLAVGKPEEVIPVRLMQLTILIGGLFLLGPIFGIAGVAIAVDAMLVTGIIMLLWRARTYVNFSLRKLVVAPTLALLIGLMLAYSLSKLPSVVGSDWRTGFVKLAVFSVGYSVVILILEHQQISDLLSFLTSRLFGKTWQQICGISSQ